MYELIDQPFENKSLKAEVEAITAAQERASNMGGVLIAEYKRHYIPVLDEIVGVKQSQYRSGGNNGLLYEWACDFGTVQSLPGAPYGTAVIVPFPDAKLPDVLRENYSRTLVEAVLDYSTRTITIKSGETVITFPTVNISLSAHEQLGEINELLEAQKAGLLAWKLSGTIGDPSIKHLYPDGRVPTIRNEHAQGNLTGYAETDRNWNAVLVYAGVVAHKTALESLHATLLQRKGISLDGYQAVPDSHFRMEVAPMPDFGLYHAALICDAALPGQWMPQDEKAYALVFRQPEQEEANVEAKLEAMVLVRLREVLPHPVRDEWAHALLEQGTEKGLIDRLKTDGDCIAGACIHLEKDWTTLLNDLLVEAVLTV